MAKNYLTVVFEYEDGAEFPPQITAAFAEEKLFHGVRITAVSLEDEMARLDEFEEKDSLEE
jgi:hypothetical protein